MRSSKSTFWTLFCIAIVVVSIFVYAARQNDRYGKALESSIASSTDSFLSAYTNTTYGFSINYPSGLIATSTFASSYLLPSYWNIYSTEDTGEQVVAFEYPGSNDVLSSQLRVGVSDDPAQVRTCDKFGQDVTVSTHAINGKDFYVGTASDAAMSHFSYAKSYRIIQNGLCFAIDLVSFGTNREVYSPPRAVPFDEKLAEAELEQTVDSFTFTK